MNVFCSKDVNIGLDKSRFIHKSSTLLFTKVNKSICYRKMMEAGTMHFPNRKQIFIETDHFVHSFKI